MDSAPPDPGVVVQFAEMGVVPPLLLPDPPLDEELPELDVLPDPLLDEEPPELDVLPDPLLDEALPEVVEPEVPDADGDPSLLLPPHPARQSVALNSDTRTLDCCTYLRGTVPAPRPSGRLSPAKIVPDDFVMVFSLLKKPGQRWTRVDRGHRSGMLAPAALKRPAVNHSRAGESGRVRQRQVELTQAGQLT